MADRPANLIKIVHRDARVTDNIVSEFMEADAAYNIARHDMSVIAVFWFSSPNGGNWTPYRTWCAT